MWDRSGALSECDDDQAGPGDDGLYARSPNRIP